MKIVVIFMIFPLILFELKEEFYYRMPKKTPVSQLLYHSTLNALKFQNPLKLNHTLIRNALIGPFLQYPSTSWFLDHSVDRNYAQRIIIWIYNRGLEAVPYAYAA